MIRILQIVNVMDRAGIETILMNYYRHIDRNSIQFDFLTHRPNNGAYDKEILSLGGKIYKAMRLYPQNYASYFSYMNKFFKTHNEYRIVHSHIDAMSTFPILAAKYSKIPVRISQSHNTSMDKDYKYPIKLVAKKILSSVSSDFWGCGEEAVKFLFGKNIYELGKYHVLHNAIEPTEFAFNEEIRNKMRNLLRIKENQFVVGHVGRFTRPKNHKFLIDIFAEIKKKISNAVLMLIGEGEDKETIKTLIAQRKLSSSVIMLGLRDDVSQLLQAMDVFLLPSLYEGIPVVAIEAQAAGLPIFVSNAVPGEAHITEEYHQISLSEHPETWANEIIKRGVDVKRQDNTNRILGTGYDINFEATKLETVYKNLWVRDSSK